MKKLLLALPVALTLAGCAPPMPEWACDDEGAKSPLCDVGWGKSLVQHRLGQVPCAISVEARQTNKAHRSQGMFCQGV